MLYPDTEARTDPLLPHPSRPARAARGAERARQSQRRRRIATVAAVTLFLMAFGIARAWAWTASVQPSTDCDGTTFNGSVGNEPGSHTAAVSFGGETKSVTVPAEGGNSFTLHFASHDGGPWSYEGTWSESSEVETASGTLPAVTDCEQEETPTPTTAPPVTQPPAEEQPPADKDDEIAGTATDQTRTPPDQHGTPTEEDTPTVTGTPNHGGSLPFTGPEHPFGMNDLQWTAFLVSLALVVGGTSLFWLSNRRQVLAVDERRLVARATARAMAGEARDGRDPNVLADMVARGRKVRDRLLGR